KKKKIWKKVSQNILLNRFIYRMISKGGFYYVKKTDRAPDQEGIGRCNLLIRVYRKLAIIVGIR
ncbi:MAG TPA: hypothetical protein VM577_18035, partial [Anaerovoracaceae bacterium]|nr:hypothetical protein [Anaerovoracaceae bacterium]